MSLFKINGDHVSLSYQEAGRLRSYTDSRRLNYVTVRESYLLLRMDEGMCSLEDAQVSSTLDSNSGYRQVKVDKENRGKTAFTFLHGLYQFIRVLLGLKNV